MIPIAAKFWITFTSSKSVVVFTASCFFFTSQGLVVPVLRNVESMNYAEIERTINALGEKVNILNCKHCFVFFVLQSSEKLLSFCSSGS